MIRTWFRELFGTPAGIAVSALFLGLVGWHLHDGSDRNRAVTQFLRAEALRSDLEAGEKLVVAIRIQKHEACAGTVNRFFIRRDDGLVCYGGAEPRGFAPVGVSDYLTSIELPDCVTAGHWSYRGVSTYACPDGPHTVIQPDVRFHVRAGTSDEVQSRSTASLPERDR